MSQSKNRCNIGSAVFLSRAIKSLGCVLFCSAMAFSLAACGDDKTSDCAKNPSSVPERMKGTIVLIYEGQPIDVPVIITTRTAAEDACKLDMVTAQTFNPTCGTAFRGILSYNTAEKRWEGDMMEFNSSTDTYNQEGTQMEVHYTERTDGYYVWNYMHSSPQEICNGRVIEGDVAADL